MNYSNIKKVLLGLSGLRMLTSLVFVFAYFSGPHFIRQNDTLGVSLRYFMRFREGVESWQSFILPAVLTSGEFMGITPMEFPFLNFIFFPLFWGGHFFGITAIRFSFILLNVFLILLNFKAWKGVQREGVSYSFAFLLLPILSISQSFIDKFMPDLCAFLLISLAMGMRLGEEKKNAVFSFFLASLALLIKPPVVIALGPLLFLLEKKELFKEICKWVVPSMIICLLYYTYGISYLKAITDMPPYFAVHFRSPMESFLGAITKPKLLFRFLVKDLFNAYILLPIISWDLYKRFVAKQEVIPLVYWLVLLLQTLCIFVLADSHLYLHTYYSMGSSFLVALIVLTFFKSVDSKFLLSVVLLAIVINQAEIMIHRSKPLRKNHLFKQCSLIRKKIDFSQIKKIRTEYRPYPTLGLCLGVIQNSKIARYGVYQKGIDKLPEGGVKVFETQDLIVKDFNSSIEGDQ